MVTIDKLKEIVVASGLKADKSEIDAEKSFAENGIDSLDTMTLLLNIEDAIGVKFSEEEVEKIKSLSSVVDILNNLESSGDK